MDDDQENQFDVPLQDSEKVLPPLGSSETSVSEDGKPTTANGRLWINLKIPKSDDFSGEESAHDQQSPKGKDSSRICNVCNKGFSSGKALGGHMRIHGDCNTINAGGPMNNRKPICSVCGKNFPSMRSLFGHMRCHPEREWRGIQPPSTAKNSSSSSTVSEAVARKTDDHIDSATTAIGSVVDLSRSLSGWSATAQRGRKSTASTGGGGNGNGSRSGSDEQIPEVVYNLMMLAQVDVSEATNSNSLSNKARIEDTNQASECAAPSKKRKIEVSPVGHRRNSPAEPVIINSGWEDTDFPRDHDHMEESDSKDTDGSMSREQLNRSYKMSKKMKKKKLRDLETPYQCKICNKTFPTGQALGGHKRCHWTRPVDHAPASQVASLGEASQTGCRIISFDLNELPAMEDEEGIESAFTQPETQLQRSISSSNFGFAFACSSETHSCKGTLLDVSSFH